MGGKRTIRVFIGSPRGLEPERRAFKQVIDELNGDFAEALDIEFEALAWEDTLSSAGLRVQTEINKDVARCDVFLLVMDDLWGRKNPDAKIHAVKCLPDLTKLRPSNTMEEFSLALKRWEETQSPEVQVLTKKLPVKTYQDTGPEGKQVIRFRKQLDTSCKVLRLEWESTEQFKNLVERILKRYAKPESGSELKPSPAPELGPEFQLKLNEMELQLAHARKRVAELEHLQATKQHKRRGKRRTKEAVDANKSALGAAKLAVLELALAEKAAQAALDGRLEEARQEFAKALDGTTDVPVLYLGFDFYYRTGELDEAQRLLKRWLAITGPESVSGNTAAALGNLGVIEQTRGNLDAAEAYHKKALSINEKLGRPEGMASAYGSLGVIEQTRGNLDAAEAFYKKALAIDEKLGRPGGMAVQFCNLGVIERTRGNLDAAEAYYKKALAIDEKLGRQEGMASDYGNLGVIEQTRGNLDAAEAYYKKALSIDEKLGSPEGMAIQFCNLGLIDQIRGNLDAARLLWVRARDLFRKIGARDRELYVQRLLDETDGGAGDEPSP